MKKNAAFFVTRIVFSVSGLILCAKVAKTDFVITGLQEPSVALLDCIANDGRVVIGARGPGFFSELFGVLNWLKWAEKKLVSCKALWDKKFLYACDSENHWLDFFEPFWDEAFFYRTKTTIVRSFFARKSSAIYSPPIKGVKNFSRLCRESGSILIEKYIKVKPDILAEVEAFCRTFFSGKHVVALHLRSDEKNVEGKQVPVSYLVNLANKMKKNNTVFFVLTDSEVYLDYAKENLEGPVVAINCFRAIGRASGVHKQYAGSIQVAREALIDVLIAAQSQVFLFTTSNLAFAVLLFNPELRGVSLQYGVKGEVTYYDYIERTDRNITSKPFKMFGVK